jgi:hypothetical protein
MAERNSRELAQFELLLFFYICKSMGILGWKPFLTKKGIGSDMPKSELKNFVVDRTVLVHVLASHYYLMLRLSKIKDEDLQREKIVNCLKKLFVEDLGFEAKKILFVFDGDLLCLESQVFSIKFL